MKKETPLGIMIISIIFLLLGVYNTAINIPALPFLVQYMDLPFVVVIVVTEVSLILVAIFLFLLKNWARVLAIALSMFFISFLSASFIQFHTFLMKYIAAYSVLIMCFITVLIYLTRPGIKAQFKQDKKY